MYICFFVFCLFVLFFFVMFVVCGLVSCEVMGEIVDVVNELFVIGFEIFDYVEWGVMFVVGMCGGFVDYVYFKFECVVFEVYLGCFVEVDFGEFVFEQFKVFFINVYNVYIVFLIFDYLDVELICDIDGVWDKCMYLVGGFELMFDNMEYNLLCFFFKDLCIYVVVNCVLQFCVFLLLWFFEGVMFDDQFDDWMMQFFNDLKYICFEEEMFYVFKFFDWYGGDFVVEGWELCVESIVIFILDYVEDEFVDFFDINLQLKIVFFDYDWGFNQVL